MSEIETKNELNDINEKLKFATEPRPKELLFVPRYMKVPVLQSFCASPMKFKKFFTDTEIIFGNREGLLSFSESGKIEIIFKARTSQNIFSVKFSKPPCRLFLSLFSIENAEKITMPLHEFIKEYFALKITIKEQEVRRQGHLFAVPILELENLDLWATLSKTENIYNHVIEDAAILRLTSEIYVVESEKEIKIDSQEHGTIVLPSGQWLLYHPLPGGD